MYEKKQIRDELAAMGRRPRRSLGQNFLTDRNVVKLALHWANVQRGDCVGEIGPGLGTLTVELLSAGATVYAVEFDPLLCENLREKLTPAFVSAFHLIHGDGVKWPLAGIPSAVAEAGGVKVVANLPYSISTPWMENLLAGPLPQSMTLLLQSETAQRFTAHIHCKRMGAISIRLAGAYDLIHSHGVGPACFHPIPRVNSTLIHLRRKDSPFIFSQPCYAAIRSLFLHRRKQLRGIVESYPDLHVRPVLRQWLGAMGCGTARPEDISQEQWQYLQMILQGQNNLPK
jgi:16S rRNA (adenine1518-N6/adenine1519-N6)-dimethyltransferase